MTRVIRVSAAAGALLALAACSTKGTGTGDLASPAGVGAERGSRPVEFQWESAGSSVTSGTISVEVPGRGTFRGQYLQINSQTEADDMNDMYWDEDWDDWDGWGSEGDAVFIEHYSGKVVATLRNELDQSMRCRFQLATPSEGPEGGGMGECQLSDGRTIENAILRGD